MQGIGELHENPKLLYLPSLFPYGVCKTYPNDSDLQIQIFILFFNVIFQPL